MIGPASVAAYAPVNATVRALYSTMLPPATRRTLAQLPNHNALLTALADTVYAPYLTLSRQLLTPRRTVYQLYWHLANVYAKLIRLTSGAGRELLIRRWQRYEVDNLKATLRGIYTGATWDEVLHLLSPMSKHINLTMDDLHGMLLSGSVIRAIDRTQGTPYHEALTHAASRFEAEQSLFPLEVALDLDYYRGVWQAIQQLHGTDREHALRLAGTTIDVDNLLWAIRYRVYHNLSPEEIINYTLPFGNHVQDAHIRAIAGDATNGSAAIDILDVIEVIKSAFPKVEECTMLAPLLQGQTTPSQRWLLTLERALHRYIIKQCHNTFRGQPFHIGVPLAYAMLVEYELRDLTAIVEAIASHTPMATLAAAIDL